MTSMLCVLIAQAVVGTAATVPQPSEATLRQPTTVLPWRLQAARPERRDLPFPIRGPARIRRQNRFAPQEVPMPPRVSSFRRGQFKPISNEPHQSILVSVERLAQVPAAQCRRCQPCACAATGHCTTSPHVTDRECTQCCRCCRICNDNSQTTKNCRCRR